jgi:16S rRNA (uracil1498-N3)-methyltransferase
MRTIRIYQPGSYTVNDVVELSAQASQHVGAVLRMQIDDALVLFCGDNREFSAKICRLDKKKVFVTILSVAENNRESPRRIHLAQAISKGDRMEWVVQKAVELGVASITPLLTSFCAVKLDAARLEKKRAQWQNIAIAACEQSGRNQVPIIYPACGLDTYLQACSAPIRLVLNPNGLTSWRDYSKTMGEVALLIGPEGGLSRDEIIQAQTNGFQSMTLGPRILRTETAAIVALSVVQAICGDL